MIGPVSRMQNRDVVIDMLVGKFADVLNEITNEGVKVEPVEVVNAALQYCLKSMKFCVRHSENHAVRMMNQSAFSQALDVLKISMLDERDKEQVM
jgi:hypothetical protein